MIEKMEHWFSTDALFPIQNYFIRNLICTWAGIQLKAIFSPRFRFYIYYPLPRDILFSFFFSMKRKQVITGIRRDIQLKNPGD